MVGLREALSNARDSLISIIITHGLFLFWSLLRVAQKSVGPHWQEILALDPRSPSLHVSSTRLYSRHLLGLTL